VPSWFVDKSGRFPQRLFLRPEEIDRDCERIVQRLLQERHGRIDLPISTEDLVVLVEEHCESIDHYADVSGEGSDVEGMTCFAPDARPTIHISHILSNAPRRENRLRTTLAHEFGHAFYHRAVFDQVFQAPPNMFERTRAEPRTVCKRANMTETAEFDWLEWQAGYVSGAVLMPATQIRRFAVDLLRDAGVHGTAVIGTHIADAVEQEAMAQFQVSREAARVRMRKLGLLSDTAGPPSLFDRA